MDKLRLGIFDIFGLLLPGYLVLIAIYLPFYDDKLVRGIFESKEQGIILLMITIAAFITGLSIHQLGYWWYCTMGLRLGRKLKTWGKRKTIKAEWAALKKTDAKALKEDTPAMKKLEEWYQLYTYNGWIGDYSILIRQFTPEQQGYLDEWTSKRALCFNLSLGFILLSLGCILAIVSNSYPENDIFIFLFCISLLASAVLLKRARVFDKWWRLESKKIVEQFKLGNIDFATWKSSKK